MSITEIMEQYGTPTLKAIAKVFDIPATRLYSVAKQPKEGEVYDAKVYNWDAVERFIQRRLEPDTELDTVEAVIKNAIEVTEQLKLTDGRRSAGVATKMIDVDGKSIVARKFESFEGVGTKICLKKDPAVYQVVYQTASHTVLIPVQEDGSAANQSVKVMSNYMLNLKGVGPAAIESAIAERFAGEVAETEAE